MSQQVDLSQLAIQREAPRPPVRARQHVVSRYVMPILLVGGLVALIGWTSWEFFVLPQSVLVVPVLAPNAEIRHEGTPLFKAAGWIEPRPTPVHVAALAPGVVESLLVVEDQSVRAGEPVAELIKDDAQLAYDRAQAEFKYREAALKEAQAAERAALVRFQQPVHLEAAFGEAEAALALVETEIKNLPFASRRAEAELQFLQSDHEGKIAAGAAVAGRAVAQARSRYEVTKALVEELHDREESLRRQRAALVRRHDALKTQLALLADETKAKEEAAAKLQAAAAQLEQARVTVAEAKLQLDRMTVRAPIEGRVYQLIGYPGSTMSAGMGRDGSDRSTVVTLYRPTMLQVRVDVRFEDIPQVILGQPVDIDNPALAKPLSGRVLFVSSEADIQKNTLEVKVAIDAPPPVLKPEMLVDVTFLAPKTSDSDSSLAVETRLFVPQQLIQHDGGGSFVWLADQSAQIARKLPIETGPSIAGGMVQAMGDLTISSRLIATGYQQLSDGDRIRVNGELPESRMTIPSNTARRPLARLRGEVTE